MNTYRLALGVAATVFALAGLSGTAMAQIPYPNAGTVNPITYTFTAAATGDVVGYFAGSTASFDEQVGLLDNGVLTSAGFGLDDHSTAIGASFDFGPVTAGDTLVFEDFVVPEGQGVFSDPTMNIGYDSIDGGGSVANHQHVYSVQATAGEAFTNSAAGTYVAFEDLPFPQSDFNYFDDTFVFTNIATSTNVPDQTSTLALIVAGLAAIAAARIGRRWVC